MMFLLLCVLCWLAMGIIVPIIGIIIDFKDGINLTVKGLIANIGLTFLGPLALVVLLFCGICAGFNILIEYVKTNWNWNQIGNHVLIKSKYYREENDIK